jgi:hypothetical protein
MTEKSEKKDAQNIEVYFATRDLILEVKDKMIDNAPLSEKRLIEKYTYDSVIWVILNDWIKEHGGENKNEKK